MLFNSFEFLIFFPVVTLLYFLFPHRHRWWLLLLASCSFYMMFIPQYIVILAVMILIDYGAGIWLEKPNLRQRQRKAVLAMSILTDRPSRHLQPFREERTRRDPTRLRPLLRVCAHHHDAFRQIDRA